MTTALATTGTPDTQSIIRLVVDGMTSEHSKRAYDRALTDFMAWYDAQGKPGLTKATVQQYREVLRAQGLSSSTVNVRMSAIRKLAAEAADNGLIDQHLANGIANVKGVPTKGTRVGNWLTKQQSQQLLYAPNTDTLRGVRNRAILAVLLGAGLRRSEVASLTMAHVQQREGRWCIVDLVGKGSKTRTVAIASWVKSSIDAWTEAAHIDSGYIFRGMNRHMRIINEQISDQAIGDLVIEYGRQIGLDLAAHDLRRTFAKLARKGGADLEQVSGALGHSSLSTTQRYLGVSVDYENAPSDAIKLHIRE